MADNDIAGIQYPFVQYGQGLPLGATGSDFYASALIGLLRTNQRSRVMRPALGTRIQQLIFDTQGPLLKTLLTREILEAVNSELPEIQITAINIQDSNHITELSVSYVIQGVNGNTGTIAFNKG